MATLTAPQDDPHCGWQLGLEVSPPAPRLEGRRRFDCAVVGAGFTGLAVARRLAELRPGWEIALLDAQRAGYGSSARSSGFVVDLAGFISKMPPPVAEAFIQSCRFGIRLLRERVEKAKIDCAWDERGWIHVAATAAGQQSLAALRGWLRGRREVLEDLDGEALAEVLGTTYYRAGIRLPGSVLVQPAALAKGLAEALPGNVRLFEKSPVLEARKGKSWMLRCPAGSLEARRVFLTTNAALGSSRPLSSRVFPLMTFGSMTRPLTAAEQGSLGGEMEWGLLAQEPLGASIRRTRDQRILVRSTLRYRRHMGTSDADRAGAAAIHRKSFLDRFPQLAEVPFEATWAGSLGMTGDHNIVFGELGQGLFAAGAYSGAGISLGTAAGHLLAEHALGEGSRELEAISSLPGPRWLPPAPFLGLGVRWHISRLEAASGGRI